MAGLQEVYDSLEFGEGPANALWDKYYEQCSTIDYSDHGPNPALVAAKATLKNIAENHPDSGYPLTRNTAGDRLDRLDDFYNEDGARK